MLPPIFLGGNLRDVLFTGRAQNKGNVPAI